MQRWLLAFPIAFIITMSVFIFLSGMIHKETGVLQNNKRIQFDMLFHQRPLETEYRLPQPPKKPTLLTTPSPMIDATESITINQGMTPIPLVSDEFDMDKTEVHIPNLSINHLPAVDLSNVIEDNNMLNQQLIPFYRVEPRYPSLAIRRKIEGYVVLSFTIDRQGYPKAIEVVEAQPRRVFEKEAIKALKQWKYQPKRIDGKTVEQLGQTIKLEFVLPK